MITVESLNSKDEEIERNPIPTKLEIEKVKLFGDLDPQLVRIRKNLPTKFKEKLV